MSVESIKRNNTWAFVDHVSLNITGRVLDVGCGAKPYKRLFPECDWVGLDARPVGDVQAEMTDIPFDAGDFDTVVCTDALGYVLDPYKAMAEMVRVLKPGGHLLVICDLLIDEGVAGYAPDYLGTLATALGCNVIRCEPFGKAFTQWTDDFFSVAQAPVLPQDLKNLTATLDARYPQISCLLAVKEDA